MKKTNHANIRQQQRAIYDQIIELVLTHGDQDSRDGFTMTNKKFNEILLQYRFQISDTLRRLGASEDVAERRELGEEFSSLKRELRLFEKSKNVRVVSLGGRVVTVIRVSGKGLQAVGKTVKNNGFH